MRRRVFMVGSEYSANPRFLPPERRTRAYLAEPAAEPSDEEVTRVFFRFPGRGDEGPTRADDWRREFGISAPIGLSDLYASAAHRTLTSLHQLAGGTYRMAQDAITAVYVTSMPGLDPNERMNIGLVPQALRAALALSPRAVAQYVVGTSDSGAWAFAQAVRAARTAEQPATILVVAGQIIPPGYTSQYQIRTVLGEDDQARGLDMLAVGDLMMDAFRRTFGVSRGDVERLLAVASARKFRAGVFYPAGVQTGKPYKRDTPRTPYFDANDIAPPCCGAAACIVTSDEALVDRIALAQDARYRTVPVTEVLGIGEGSTNENLLHRQSPLVFGTAVREALADTADDAGLPISAFASSAFGVAHDAFTSIELSFLLGMGLSWERSAERLIEGWPNPFGGLLTFGHALGASGLVQVNKAHHLFCGDRRYVKDGSIHRQGFRETGAVAFTSSVGGPLSHIVCSLLRGGFDRVRAPKGRAPRAELDLGPQSSMTEWRTKRHQLRLAIPAYLGRLESQVDGEPWLVEGTTYVSIRSALRALTPDDVARLTFDGLENLVAVEHIEKARAQLREVVLIVLGEMERWAMFDVFRLLTDEVKALAESWRADGLLGASAAAIPEKKLTDRVKEFLRVPLAVLVGPRSDPAARRRVLFLPQQGLTFESLDGVQVLQASPDGRLEPIEADLPFWNLRARRPVEKRALGRAGSPSELIDRILESREDAETAGEIGALRLWFSPDPPRAALTHALVEAGAAIAEPSLPVRTVVFAGEIADPGPFGKSGGAHELLGRAAREARAFLEAYETSLVQVGELLALSAFERPPFRTRADEGLTGAARFAREVARAAFERGIVLHGAICAGEGEVFEDANRRPGLASPALARAYELLLRLRGTGSSPALIVDGATGLVLERLQQRLPGWAVQIEADCVIFRL